MGGVLWVSEGDSDRKKGGGEIPGRREGSGRPRGKRELRGVGWTWQRCWRLVRVTVTSSGLWVSLCPGEWRRGFKRGLTPPANSASQGGPFSGAQGWLDAPHGQHPQPWPLAKARCRNCPASLKGKAMAMSTNHFKASRGPAPKMGWGRWGGLHMVALVSVRDPWVRPAKGEADAEGRTGAHGPMMS